MSTFRGNYGSLVNYCGLGRACKAGALPAELTPPLARTIAEPYDSRQVALRDVPGQPPPCPNALNRLRHHTRHHAGVITTASNARPVT
jgi:hypothetical protein